MIKPPGQRAGWCVHYEIRGPNGEDLDACAAGVKYETLKGTKFQERPCFLTDNGESKPGAVACAKLLRPTPEQILERKVWHDKRMKNLGTVMAAIMPWREANKGKGAQQIIDCPACGGKKTLNMSVARNGHVHAKCATPGCVSFME